MSGSRLNVMPFFGCVFAAFCLVVLDSSPQHFKEDSKIVGSCMVPSMRRTLVRRATVTPFGRGIVSVDSLFATALLYFFI